MLVKIIPGDGDLEACRAIRRTVFIEEQNVTEEEEWDGLDATCIHFLAVDDRPVGTARLLSSGAGTAKAQRVAVLASARRSGVGAALMAALEAEAARLGHTRILLGAQIRALPFYERQGYEAYGPEFDDAGIAHRMMRKPLSKPTGTQPSRARASDRSAPEDLAAPSDDS